MFTETNSLQAGTAVILGTTLGTTQGPTLGTTQMGPMVATAEATVDTTAVGELDRVQQLPKVGKTTLKIKALLRLLTTPGATLKVHIIHTRGETGQTTGTTTGLEGILVVTGESLGMMTTTHTKDTF